MAKSDYVPGAISMMLKDVGDKKKKKKKKVKEDGSPKKEKTGVAVEIEPSEDLSSLFTAKPKPVQSVIKANKKSAKKKKRTNSQNDVEENGSASSKKLKLDDGVLVPDDSTENAEEPEKKSTRKKRVKDSSEKLVRTVFVGNLPVDTEKKALKTLFKKYGNIESMRFRSVVAADLKTPKRVAFIKKETHPERTSMNAYIVYEEAESAQKALELNGHKFNEHYMRVDVAGGAKKHNHKKSIFVGNIPFDAKEETLREHFVDCGVVENVRIIRDKKTGLGKGFGYINFEESHSVDFALKLNGQTLKNRPLRIQRSTENAPKLGKDSTKPTPRKDRDNKIAKSPKPADPSPKKPKKEKKMKKLKAASAPADDYQGHKAENEIKTLKKKKKNRKPKLSKAALTIMGEGHGKKKDKGKAKDSMKTENEKSVESAPVEKVAQKDEKKQKKDKKVKFDKIKQNEPKNQEKKKSVTSKKVFARNRLAKKFKKGKL